MKKLLVLMAMALLAAPYAFAGSSSGCGLGYIVFQGQSGMVPNVLAVTTNGTFGTQTFGITSGTSGCNAGDTVYNETMQEEFVAVNYEKLSQDMARGDGQYVAALAELMGCEPAARADFARVSRANYERLFATSDMDAKGLLTGLKLQVANDPMLSGSCTRA